MGPEGKLTTQGGAPVLDDGGGEILIDPLKGPVNIARDGTVSQGAERIGKVGVARFGDLASLSKDGDNLYRNLGNEQPQQAPDAIVHQGMLESSNVQSVLQITKLIEVSRAYERMAKMMDNAAELTRSAVERLGKAN